MRRGRGRSRSSGHLWSESRTLRRRTRSVAGRARRRARDLSTRNRRRLPRAQLRDEESSSARWFLGTGEFRRTRRRGHSLLRVDSCAHAAYSRRTSLLPIGRRNWAGGCGHRDERSRDSEFDANWPRNEANSSRAKRRCFSIDAPCDCRTRGSAPGATSLRTSPGNATVSACPFGRNSSARSRS